MTKTWLILSHQLNLYFSHNIAITYITKSPLKDMGSNLSPGHRVFWNKGLHANTYIATYRSGPVYGMTAYII